MPLWPRVSLRSKADLERCSVIFVINPFVHPLVSSLSTDLPDAMSLGPEYTVPITSCILGITLSLIAVPMTL